MVCIGRIVLTLILLWGRPSHLFTPHLSVLLRLRLVCSYAREVGKLKVSIHCAEVMNVREAETVLNFRPDRLGHMVVLVRFAEERRHVGP